MCLAIYRTTNLFPPDEPLKNQLRKASSEVVILLAQGEFRDTILKVGEIKIFLDIAKAQNWLKPVNFDFLRNVYLLLADALSVSLESEEGVGNAEKVIEKKPKPTPLLPKPKKEERPIRDEDLVISEADLRQRKIIAYLKENKRGKLSDFLSVLGNVSDRTIRNDLTDLINNNLIKRIGSNKDARYLPINYFK